MKLQQFISLDQPLPVDVYKLAVDRAYNQIIITNTDGIIVYANSGLERTTGYNPKEVIGHTPRTWGGLMDQEFYEQFWKCVKIDKKPYQGEIKNHRKDGSIYYAILTTTPLLDYNGLLSGFIGIEEEITTYKDIKAKLQDYITNLELKSLDKKPPGKI